MLTNRLYSQNTNIFMDKHWGEKHGSFINFLGKWKGCASQRLQHDRRNHEDNLCKSNTDYTIFSLSQHALKLQYISIPS